MSKGKVIEYTLDEAWDVTTATFSDDGSSMFLYYPEVDKEEAIREKYPDVKRLYEEYRVALILAAGEEL